MSEEILTSSTSTSPCTKTQTTSSSSVSFGREQEEEEGLSSEEGELDELEKLKRICKSDKFNLNGVGLAHKKKQNKGKGKNKKKNKYIISSSSYCYSETAEEEELRLGLEDVEFVQKWKQHWENNGEEILWNSWNHKYKDYINPNYNLVDYIRNIGICSSSDSDSEGAGVELEIMTSRRRNKKRKRSTADLDSDAQSWQEAWEQHCTDEHSAEYLRFSENYYKMRRSDGQDAYKIPRLRKYWAQRYSLFTKYDEGIKLDYESWFSVTPEPIAAHIANVFSERKCNGVILDAFAGCGGNSIQFAKICEKVIAVDIDPIKIEYCKHNAEIYGVQDNIEFIVGDFMELAPTLKADAVFLSPPWGGPAYQSAQVFDVETMIPMNGRAIAEIAKTVSPNIAYLLPRNVNQDQVTMMAGAGNFVQIEKNYYNDKVKTITAYYGQLIDTEIGAGG